MIKKGHLMLCSLSLQKNKTSLKEHFVISVRNKHILFKKMLLIKKDHLVLQEQNQDLVLGTVCFLSPLETRPRLRNTLYHLRGTKNTFVKTHFVA